jgi:hypothetical protein
MKQNKVTARPVAYPTVKKTAYLMIIGKGKTSHLHFVLK